MVLLKDLFEEKKKGQRIQRVKNRPSKGKKKSETGFYRTSLCYCPSCKKKEFYKYTYMKNGKQKSISSIDFMKLRSRIKEEELEWRVKDVFEARKTAKKLGILLKDLE